MTVALHIEHLTRRFNALVAVDNVSFDIEHDEDGVRKSIGIVFQDQSLDEELTAWENMDFHGRLYRIPAEIRMQRITELLNLVELVVKPFNRAVFNPLFYAIRPP